LTGRTTSAPIETEKVEQFAIDVVKEYAFARGYTEDDLVTMGLEKIIDEIRAEQAAEAEHQA
jgi:hypothetical protein